MTVVLFSCWNRRIMEQDITTNDLLGNRDVFADVANVNLFEGKRLILPEDLEMVPLETSYKDLEGKHHRLFRDTLMKVRKLGGCIAFIGYESQTDINRTMPVRDMGYTYTGYAKQIREIVAKNNADRNSAYTKVLHEHQKLMPMATFILYFGEEEWKTPLSMMDILDIPKEEKEFWKNLIHDYPIHVIHMAKQPEEVRKKYQSDYGVIADYLAYHKDKEKVDRHLRQDNRRLVHVEQVLDMLQVFSGDKRFEEIKKTYIENDGKKECDTMCLLLDACEERGMQQKAKDIAKNLLKIGLLSVTVIAQSTGLSVEEVEALAKEEMNDLKV